MDSLSFSEAIYELMHNNTKTHHIISVSRQKEIILSHFCEKRRQNGDDFCNRDINQKSFSLCLYEKVGVILF